MQPSDARSAPEGLPQLRAGAHLSPEDGACLMEYVSVLAGTTFNDHPSCTDPTVATVARLVNDASTDAGRPLLARFAPLLAETGATPDARRTAAVIRATVRAASAAAGDPARLRRLLRGAERRYDLVTNTGRLAGLARRLDTLHRYGAGRRRMELSILALRELPRPRRDEALRATLAAALAAALLPTGSPAVEVLPVAPTARVPSSRSPA
ncbi:hypothetical protein [Modestobacter excelsi]|uniref:hypothetical protein n=1 Tax=Modestobacter excelsi TaxID=2213161 RepID=UPI00110CDE3C|nr:hypothetical protein [Modestobacter excelsi]